MVRDTMADWTDIMARTKQHNRAASFLVSYKRRGPVFPEPKVLLYIRRHLHPLVARYIYRLIVNLALAAIAAFLVLVVWLGMPLGALVLVVLAIIIWWRIATHSGACAVVVGCDGVLVKGGEDSGFISFADVERVDAQGPDPSADCMVLLHSGRSVTLRTREKSQRGRFRDELRRRLEAFNAKLEEDLPSCPLDEQLARAKRLAGETRAADFRTRAEDENELRALCRNPTASLVLRASAAVALDRLGGDGRAELRLAAAQTAEPSVRMHLEQMADATAAVRDTLMVAIVAAEERLLEAPLPARPDCTASASVDPRGATPSDS